MPACRKEISSTADDQSANINEETRRLIRLFKPAATGIESSWNVDVSRELAWYLQMLQQPPDAENISTESNVLQSTISAGGINFSHASTVVVEATRLYSRKVDYLRQQIDYTLNSITNGTVGTNAPLKGLRKGRHTTKGHLKYSNALSPWEIHDVPEATEIMRLPWLSYWRKKKGQHLLPSEAQLHQTLFQTLSAALEEDTFESAAQSVQSRFRHEPIVESAPTPIPKNLVKLARARHLLLVRPPMAVESNATGAPLTTERKQSFSEQITSHINQIKLLSAPMHKAGILYTQTTRQALLEALSAVSGFHQQCVPTSPEPRSSLLNPRSSAPLAYENDAVTAQKADTKSVHLRNIPAPAPPPKVKAFQGPVFLDAHELVGRDLPLRPMKRFNTREHEVALFNMKASDIDSTSAADLLITGMMKEDPDLAKDKFSAWLRSKGLDPSKGLLNLIFVTDKVWGKRALLDEYSLDNSFICPDWLMAKSTKRMEMRQSVVAQGEDMNGDVPDGWEETANFEDEDLEADANILSPQANPTEDALVAPPTKNKDLLYQLHERVSHWSEQVEKWVAETNRTGAFIIPKYVERIGDRAGGKTTVKFKDITQGVSRAEVCRLFLTTLILANRHDFKMKNDAEDLEILVNKVDADDMKKSIFDDLADNAAQPINDRQTCETTRD